PDSGPALQISEVRSLGDQPAFALGRAVDVIGETRHQQKGCDRDKPANRLLEPAQPCAQLGCQILHGHNQISSPATRFSMGSSSAGGFDPTTANRCSSSFAN